MSENRLSSRNAAIQEMLTDGEKIQNFYRFVAQNPHISLHDACQIIISRPTAGVCYSFEEWNAMGRRITRGRKGVPYYDADGYKQFVFDANDTHGEERYKRLVYPIKRMLQGLDALNGTEMDSDLRGDYRKIHVGVATYLQENGYFTDDEERNRLILEGVTYSLYSKTGFPKNYGITMHGMTGDLTDNAQLFKDVCGFADFLHKEIEEAYVRKQNEVKVIDDVDEETVSDEPIVSEKADKADEHKIVFSSAVNMFRQNYVILTDYDKVTDQTRIFIGKQENLDTETNEYDNSDDSLIFATNRPQMPYLLYGKSFPRPQQSYIDNGTFEAEDYAEYAELKDGVLKDILVAQALKFDYDQSDPNSGVPFRYPNWQDEKATVAQTEAEPQLPPFYKEYLTEQEKYPKAIVLTRLGDFYEMFGESAEKASDALNLTLTGRIVGVDRIPMCGVPFHATDAYIEKLIKQYPVVVLEKDKEPIYIQSHAESLAQNEEAEKPAPKLIEVDDDGDNPFDNDEQLMPDEENGDEHPDYIGEIDTRFPIDDEYDDEYAAEQNELEDEDDAAYDDENIDKEQAEEEKENRPQTKPKQSKPIQSRKRKEKPQLSFFDMLDGKTQEKTPQEQLIEYGLKIGSGVHQGKFRIYDKYKENPTVEDFADFLKKEYGVGGGGYELEVWHDAKGLRLKQRDKSGNEICAVLLKWKEVAVGIADLIDDNEYFTAEEKEKYEQYRIERKAERERFERGEKLKDEFVKCVIGAADQDRKERIQTAYLNSPSTFVQFLRSEYGNSVQAGDDYRLRFNVDEFWLTKYDENGNTEAKYTFALSQFADRIGKLIDSGEYMSLGKELTPEQAKIKAIVDGLIKDGTENTTEGNWITSFSRFGADEQFVREHQNEIADELESREEVSDVIIADESFDVNYYTDYTENLRSLDDEEDEEWERRIRSGELKPIEQPAAENTDLNEIGFDQSELGGAKARFKSNIEAISSVRLMKFLF